jgi:hypothetical protein
MFLLRSLLTGSAAFILLLAGWNYAQGRTIVIPFDMTLTESEATAEILALKARVDSLEALLACIDSTSNAGQFTIQGCNVVIQSDQQIDLVIGTDGIELDPGVISISASAQLTLDGGVILGSGGGAPVARVGDTVSTPAGPGVILSGNATVLF